MIPFGTILMERCSEDPQRWLALKSRRVGSSEIATVCEMNPYCTPFELWALMTGKIPPEPENEDMRQGKAIEPYVGARFARERRMRTVRPDILIGHPEHSFVCATPDFLAGHPARPDFDALLEAKFSKGRNWRLWADGPPRMYVLQLNWQMGISGIYHGWIAGLIGGDELISEEFHFSRKLFDFQLEQAHRFIQLVIRDVPPDAGPGDSRLIAELQGKRLEKTVPLDRKALENARRFRELVDRASVLKTAAKELSDEADRFKGRLLQSMGAAKSGILPNGQKVFAKTRERKAHNVGASSWVEVSVK